MTTTRRYAAGTDVPVNQTMHEIEKLVIRYKASEFAYGWLDSGGAVAVSFRLSEWRIQLKMSMPSRSERRFTHGSTGRPRSPNSAEQQYEAACRQRWRALKLVIQAKFEAIELGITSFEREFFADAQMPDGRTVFEWAQPAVQAAIAGGTTPQIGAR